MTPPTGGPNPTASGPWTWLVLAAWTGVTVALVVGTGSAADASERATRPEAAHTGLPVKAVTNGRGRTAGGGEKPDAGRTARMGGLYEQIVDAYMDARWDELERALARAASSIAGLTPSQRQDVAYVRRTVAECRPSWWQPMLKGQEVAIEMDLVGNPFAATFEPAKRNAFKTGRIVGRGRPELTVSWNPAPLTSTGPAEGSMARHGFTKRDIANLDAWTLLGRASVYAAPGKTLMDLLRGDRKRLKRYMIFRSNATALYHASPPARRAAVVMCLGGFSPAYGEDKVSSARRAAGALFLAEVLAHPDRWPSLPMPRSVRESRAEARAAKHFQREIGPAWTIAEDRALREAVREFDRKNDRQALEQERVTLPNGRLLMLDYEADKPYRQRRDAWVAERVRAIVGE